MTDMMAPTQPTPTTQPEKLAEPDLVAAVQQVFQASEEPLTLPKIRAALPVRLRGIPLEELGEVLHRQVAAKVLYEYPKYRSKQDRFWDRPMPVHVAALVREVLTEGPLPLTALRRKLPYYAQALSETVVQEQLAQGNLHRHPPVPRSGERYGVQPPEAKSYIRAELAEVFARLEQLGFQREQLRQASLDLLQASDWTSLLTPPAPVEETTAADASASEPTEAPAAEMPAAQA